MVSSGEILGALGGLIVAAAGWLAIYLRGASRKKAADLQAEDDLSDAGVKRPAHGSPTDQFYIALVELRANHVSALARIDELEAEARERDRLYERALKKIDRLTKELIKKDQESERDRADIDRYQLEIHRLAARVAELENTDDVEANREPTDKMAAAPKRGSR